MATRHVSPSGNNVGAGTTLNPWKTLQYAVDNILPGDTLVVRPGTYSEKVVVPYQASGSASARTVIACDSGVILDGNYTFPTGPLKADTAITVRGNTSLGYVSSFLFTIRANHFEIQGNGMEVKRSRGSGVLINGLDTDRRIEVLISDLTIHGMRYQPLRGDECDEVLVDGVETYDSCNHAPFSRSGSELNWCVAVNVKDGTDQTITNCTIHEHWGEGIAIAGGTDGIISYNTVYNTFSSLYNANRSTGLDIFGNFGYHTNTSHLRGGYPTNGMRFDNEGARKQGHRPGTNNVRCYNNILVGCGNNLALQDQLDGGIREGYEDCDIYNNTFINSVNDPDKTAAVNIAPAPFTRVKIRNNIFYQTNRGSLVDGANNGAAIAWSNNIWWDGRGTQPPAQVRGTGDLYSDPKIVNARIPAVVGTGDINDYRLLSTSPAINAGIAIAGLTVDISTGVRGGLPDIGAWEYASLGSGTITANYTGLAGSGSVPYTQALTNTSGSTGSCTINQYRWEYNRDNNGWVQFSTSASPTFTATVAGVYQVRLTTSCTALGLSDDETKTINLSGSTALTADFSYALTVGGANCVYSVPGTALMLFGGEGIYRSTDEGDTWTLVETPGNGTQVWDFIQAGSRLYAAVGIKDGVAETECGIYYSTDNGVTWTQQLVGAQAFKFARRQNGELFASGTNHVYQLVGSTWQDAGAPVVGDITAMLVTRQQTLLVGGIYNVYRQTPGESFVQVTTLQSEGPFTALAESAVIVLGSAFDVCVSWDDGLNFELARDFLAVNSLYTMANGDVLMGDIDGGETYISRDGGLTWERQAFNFTGPIGGFTENAGGEVFMVDAANIWKRAPIAASFNVGPTDLGCESLVYIANKRTLANITVAKVYDHSATSYTTYRADQISNVSIFPPTPFANDALYVGVQGNITNTGPISNLVFELASGNATSNVTVEYYDVDTGWTDMIAYGLTDMTYSLRRSGIVSWEGVNWAKSTIDGVNAYWVRFRVTDPGTETIAPVARAIYSATQPYIDLPALPGDIPTLLQAELVPQTAGDMETFNGNNGMLIGARSLARGEQFNAFVNLAETQNTPGIGVTGTFVNDLTASAVGQHVHHTQTTIDDWDTACSVAIDTGLAAQYAGVFQMYVRYRFRGDFSAMQLRGQINNRTGDPVYLTPANAFRLQHLGTFHIADSQLFEQELSAPLYIEVEAFCAEDAIRNALDLTEIILLPADEWIGEFVDPANNSGIYTTIIDSATFPRRALRAYTRKGGTRYVAANWRASAGGPFALDRGKATRLWFVQQSFDEGVLSSPFAAVQKVRLFGHARYLALRGAEGGTAVTPGQTVLRSGE